MQYDNRLNDRIWGMQRVSVCGCLTLSYPLPSREMDSLGFTEEVQDTSCRGPGGVPQVQIPLSPPLLKGDSGSSGIKGVDCQDLERGVSRPRRNVVLPRATWIPAFAGMTGYGACGGAKPLCREVGGVISSSPLSPDVCRGTASCASTGSLRGMQRAACVRVSPPPSSSLQRGGS